MTTTKIARQLAREFRKNHTKSELLLWDRLRNKKFMELRFLRQHPIFYKCDDTCKFFIADFYCNEIKLVIEVDGKIHQRQKNYDQARTEIMGVKNINVVRFHNEDIISSLNSVLLKLKDKVIKLREH